MLITNATIVSSDFNEKCLYDIEIKDCKFSNISKSNICDNSRIVDIIDCKGNYVFPGFIDIHFHGCMNYDFCDASEEALSNIVKYQCRNGITSICPATMTYTEDILRPIMKAAGSFKNNGYADLVGINMEGPFISKDKVGAQNPKYVLKPNFDMIKRLDNYANGLIKLIDVAPEVDGCLDFIKVASNDYRISLAHTCTDYQTASRAFKCGASHLTHLFNAMNPITHRQPGPIIAGFENNAMAEIICDGNHIHYSVVKMAFKLFGANNMILISDSCRATGMPIGVYDLGGQEIYNDGDKAVLNKNRSTIAASTSNLYKCFCHAVKDANINITDAVKACTINPAKALGINNQYGKIYKDYYADFIIADKNLNIVSVYKNGDLVL